MKSSQPQVPKKIPVNLDNLSEKSLRSWGLPTHYKDELYKCVDCGITCLFTAVEQQQWYEEVKRYYWQRPNRCSIHHDEWREKRKHKFEMDRDLELLKQTPNDKEIMLKCAKSIVQFHKDTGAGNLQTVLCLLKKLELQKSLYKYCINNINKPKKRKL